jgi:hypothetical protein
LQNICVVVYREKNGKPRPKHDRSGTPILKEVTRLPDGLSDDMIIYWEDIDPWAGDACRNQAFSMGRFWLDKTLSEDRQSGGLTS